MQWIGFLPFAVFFLYLFFNAANFKKDCPDCGERLPFWQDPATKTRRQWFKGGCLCRNCGCETDSAGRKVASSPPPRRAWLLLAKGLAFVLVVALSSGLVFALLNR